MATERWGVWLLPPGLGGRWIRRTADLDHVWSGTREEAHQFARERANDEDLRECLVEARVIPEEVP